MRLARVVSRTFDSARPYGPELVDFLCDLARLHGLPQREEYFGLATRVTFTEMAQEIAAELAESNETEPFGLAVVAHSTPDAEPGWPASYLTGALPGEPLAFAVADQGAAAPFTALRIAADLADTGGARCPIGLGPRPRRAVLVLIMDQTAVVPDRRLPRGTVLPSRDHAVALVFEPAGRLAELSVRQLTDARPADALAELEAELRSGSGPVTVVLGPGLASAQSVIPALAEAGRVVHAPADLPGTGPWHELARLLRQPDAAGGRILLASYEQRFGYLDLCSVSVTAPVREVAAQRSMTGVRAT